MLVSISASGAKKYSKGDRLIVDMDKELFVATVTVLRGNDVHMLFDDGMKGKLPYRSKKILGFAKGKRKRKTPILKKDLPKWLLSDKEKGKTDTKAKKAKVKAITTTKPHAKEKKPKKTRLIKDKDLHNGFKVRVNPALTALDYDLIPDENAGKKRKNSKASRPSNGVTIYERPRLDGRK